MLSCFRDSGLLAEQSFREIVVATDVGEALVTSLEQECQLLVIQDTHEPVDWFALARRKGDRPG
jgi:hypothetical protein